MKIDKLHLKGEIAGLRDQEKTAFQQLSGIQGAIQMCEHLVKVLDMEEPPEENIPDIKDILPEGAEIIDRTPNEKGEKDAVAKGKKERAKEKAT